MRDFRSFTNFRNYSENNSGWEGDFRPKGEKMVSRKCADGDTRWSGQSRKKRSPMAIGVAIAGKTALQCDNGASILPPWQGRHSRLL